MSGIVVHITVKKIEDQEKVERGELIRKLADFLYRRARFFTPVKTGKLKRGWRVTRTGSRITLRNRVKYASYINSGETKAKDPAKGLMWERALKEAIKYIRNRYDVDLNKIVTIERLDN